MNASEKKMLTLALFLLGMGLVVRAFPLRAIPPIESFQVETVASQPTRGESDTMNSQIKKKKSSSRRKKVVFQGPVAINHANSEELCRLKGVGPKLAAKILEYRKHKGPFKKASDLQKVSGIGKKKAETILHGVIFD